MGHIIHKQGNLFTSTAPAIGHGVNCRGAMGAGIAKTFREMYPDMYEAYRVQCEDGTLTPGSMMGWVAPEDSKLPTVYNIASQDFPGPNAQLVWIGTGLFYAIKHAESMGYDRIAIPRIGAGLGGLEWDAVEAVVAGQIDQSNIDIEVWTL